MMSEIEHRFGGEGLPILLSTDHIARPNLAMKDISFTLSTPLNLPLYGNARRDYLRASLAGIEDWYDNLVQTVTVEIRE